MLQQIVYSILTDPTAKVWYDGIYDKDYRADYIYTGTENGREVRRSVQVKTVSALNEVGPRMRDGARQLNGEAASLTTASRRTRRRASNGSW